MPTGLLTTYDLTTGLRLDMRDFITQLDPSDVPLLRATDVNGMAPLSTDTCIAKEISWLDDTLLTGRSTLGATAATADAYITVASGDRNRFGTNDVLIIDSGSSTEGVLVTGYGTTTDTLTVTRKWNTSTAFSHAPSVSVISTGQAAAEGSDAGDDRSTDRSKRSNITQIFGPRTVKVSGTENSVAKYGIQGTEFDYQLAKKMRELYVDIEQAVIYGQKFESTDDQKRTMGGIDYFIQTNVDSSTTSLTESAFLDQVETCYEAGGRPRVALVGPKQKRVISGWDSTVIRFGRTENTRGQVVDFVETDFDNAPIHVVLDRNVRNSDLFLFDRDQATLRTLTGRDVAFEMLAKTGDSQKGMVLCEKTLEFQAEGHAAKFNALT